VIRHVVTWKLKAQDDEGRARSVEAIAGALEPLVGVIDGLLALKISPNAAYFESNWDVVLVADYPTVADLDAYQVHPDHVVAAAIVREHVDQRVAVDIEV
jgi:hypothetical protein